MFRKGRIRRRGGVILYTKESIQSYEIKKKKREADCDEAAWCNIVIWNSSLTI